MPKEKPKVKILTAAQQGAKKRMEDTKAKKKASKPNSIKMKCNLCKSPITGMVNMTQHFESKHKKEPLDATKYTVL